MNAERISQTKMPDNHDTIDSSPISPTNSWQSAYETTRETLPAKRANNYRSFWAVMAVLVLPLAFALEIITDSLADLEFLNSHRLWPIREHASTLSLSELATNATIWQSAIYGFMVLSVPVFLWGFVVLAKQAKR